MKPALIACLAGLFISTFSIAQPGLTMLPSGGNKKASVSEQIGLTQVTIHYDRPAVKGREGKIWGELIPVGYTDQGFGNTKAAPWRAGANENTTIEFSTDVKIEGQKLAAGKYGFFIAYDPSSSTLIFSKNSNSWGSYYYDDKEDALRVKVKPVALDKSVEWLKYEFTNEQPAAATVLLSWEKLGIPFKLEVDYEQTQLESFRRQLRTDMGFTWQPWNQAAQWCLSKNINLEQALLWSDSATSTTFGGDKEFAPWVVKAQLLEKTGKTEEAAAIMKKVIPLGNMNDIHAYGRSLLQQKKSKEALEVFKQNHQKYPGQFTTLMGLTRGYSANGDYKNALKYATQALPLAPDSNNKTNVTAMIEKLKAGKDVN